jgi:hypothetical protein
VRTIAACALALTLAACATNRPALSEQDRDDALLAMNACLDAAARKLDDGTSEASTIALGMRPSCAAEFARSRDVYASAMNPEAVIGVGRAPRLTVAAEDIRHLEVRPDHFELASGRSSRLNVQKFE